MFELLCRNHTHKHPNCVVVLVQLSFSINITGVGQKFATMFFNPRALISTLEANFQTPRPTSNPRDSCLKPPIHAIFIAWITNFKNESHGSEIGLGGWKLASRAKIRARGLKNIVANFCPTPVSLVSSDCSPPLCRHGCLGKYVFNYVYIQVSDKSSQPYLLIREP